MNAVTLAKSSTLTIGDARLTPQIEDGRLLSLGEIVIADCALRNPSTRMLPWFDTYDGDIFRVFQFQGIEKRGDTVILRTLAHSDPDVIFRERRDSSGDLAFRNVSWDAPALQAEFDIHLAPTSLSLDGRTFTGFKYWFSFRSEQVKIHRLLDRQTWEIGGNLDDVTIVCRNWLTPPRMRLTRETTYSTVGLDHWAGLLPGNMWGRWSLLPSFDMQVGKAGIMLGYFDQVSLIRTAIETNAGEEYIRHMDLHGFENSHHVTTNPKSMVWCADQLDDVETMNLWTRMHDRERDKARVQFNIPEEIPPQIGIHQNWWINFRYEKSYEAVMQMAHELNCDYIFVDPPWEHQQAFYEYLCENIPEEKRKGTIFEKFQFMNMCVTLDFEAAQIHGGEVELKKLCDRARDKGLFVISWMATHYSPNTQIAYKPELKHDDMGMNIWAARESGRHPDTGYANACWTANLNGPVYEKIRDQIIGLCQRTGLKGFLWDSYCNLGWWQKDYAKGTMRPQYDKMTQLYAELVRAGLYMTPEAIVTYSSHSCCGLHGGNVYAGNQLGYSYDTSFALHYAVNPEETSLHTAHEVKIWDAEILKGKAPISILYDCLAYKRMPGLNCQNVPRNEWDPQAVIAMRELFTVYKKVRHLMKRRTVLKDFAGVIYDNDTSTQVLWTLKTIDYQAQRITDALTGEVVKGGSLAQRRVYLIER